MLRMVFGGLVAVAVCGVATAQPPRAPLSEGRELDPVVRDYYQGQLPAPPAETRAPRSAPVRGDSRAWIEAILNGITLPLGPCMTPGM